MRLASPIIIKVVAKWLFTRAHFHRTLGSLDFETSFMDVCLVPHWPAVLVCSAAWCAVSADVC